LKGFRGPGAVLKHPLPKGADPSRFDSSLRLIFWELTAGCNLKCIHCRAVATPERLKEELTLAEVKSAIDDIASFSSPILILTGGEPLFRPDIFDIAGYARDVGLRTALATNGTLVTEQVARRIVDSGVARVSISIDGADAKTHDAFRSLPGSFDAALAGFGRLKKLGMSLQLNTTVARHNAGQVGDIVELALKLGADALHIFMLVPVGCGVQIADDQMIPAAEYERILNWFYDRSIELKGRLEFKATCAPHYYRIARQRGGFVTSGDERSMSAMTRGCLAGSAVCFISRTGDVQPCGYLPVAAGNIRRESLEKIWKEAALFRELRDPSLLKGKCGACEYRRACMGCRARAYYEKNDYLAEEPYCLYEPMSGGKTSIAGK
jgi:heme b synthase